MPETAEVTEATAPIPARAGPLRAMACGWFGIALWKRILAALIAGVAVGLLAGESAGEIKWIGDVFVRLIRMLVTPLVFVTIAAGVAALGDPKRLGTIGAKTLAMYALTTVIAATVGLVAASLFAPGAGATFGAAVPGAIAAPRPPSEIFIGIIPMNPIQAMAEGDTLAVIFFAVLVGAGVIVAGESAAPLRRLLDAGSAVMLRIVGFVMETAPFGVFALIAVVVGANGPQTFVSVFWLAVCVIVGAAVQTVIVHGAVVRIGAWLPVMPFFRGIADAIMVGFSTASSSATLPVAMRVAERNLGVASPISSTVLPLGATIGMDGAAMYVAMLAMFAVQAFGVSLGPADYLTIIATTSIVSMGVAPVPSGSLFVLAAVLASIGVSPEQTALLVGFIMPFDRILDMIRTIPNVTTDLAVATAVARWEDEIDTQIYRSADDE